MVSLMDDMVITANNGMSVTISKELFVDLYTINKINAMEVITTALESITKKEEVDEAVINHLNAACEMERSRDGKTLTQLLASARNEALEEAARALEEYVEDHQLTPAQAAADIRALKFERRG